MNTAPFIPTKSQIRAACYRLQSTWSEQDRRRRAGLRDEPTLLAEVSLAGSELEDYRPYLDSFCMPRNDGSESQNMPIGAGDFKKFWVELGRNG